jgi:hypothetical protein
MRATRTLLFSLAIALVVTVPAAADPLIWRLEQPPPPPGAPFTVPLGPPGDLKFFAPNRGLLAVEGNATVARGLLVYDGAGWRQLSTVCGGAADTTRIAWAGPTEFWTVTQPSPPRVGSGTSLCHFRDGQVVASYSTPEESSDPFRQMFSAACRAPDDCWFGGIADQDATGERVGAFHLHWNGQSLTTHYAPRGRGVSDVEPFGTGFYETTLAGRRPENREPPDPPNPGISPKLIQRIQGGVFSDDPFEPLPRPGLPPDGTELLGLDSEGSEMWAVGGGAASGPAAPAGGMVARPPVAARLVGGVFAEVPLDETLFAPGERLSDVAVIPGSSSVWSAVQAYADRRSANSRAKLALIAADGTTETIRLPASGSGRGSAARIACPAANDCWLVTYGGWVFHWSDGTRPPRDADPAFANVITFRPNESAEQFVPDRPPADISQLFAPPPLEVEQAAPPRRRGRRLPPLMRRIRSRVVRKRILVVSFTLVRPARVALIARRRGSVVARTKQRRMTPGRRQLRLRLNPKRWPTRLTFRVREPGQQRGGGMDENTVTTGPPSTP